MFTPSLHPIDITETLTETYTRPLPLLIRRGEIEGRTQIKFNGPKWGNGPKWLMKKETEIEKVIKRESIRIAFIKTEN